MVSFKHEGNVHVNCLFISSAETGDQPGHSFKGGFEEEMLSELSAQ